MNEEKKLIKVFFQNGENFTSSRIRPTIGIVGLYFIFNESIKIRYPYGSSKLIYIGMSERKTNSMGKRLQGHHDGTSGNVGIINYRQANKLLFTYINYSMLAPNWPLGIEPLESYFISSFVERYGVYPICNNKSGTDLTLKNAKAELEIDWEFFENERN